MSSIAIIGCGNLGTACANLFLKKNIHVKVLSRKPEKCAALKTKGAEIIEGDVCSEEAVNKLLSGTEVVFTAFHAMLGRGKNSSKKIDDDSHCNLVDAAVNAGVHQFIYTSVAFAAPNHPVDFWRTKFNVEQYLKRSGLNYTILRPSAFMETHMHFLVGKSLLEKGKVFLFGKGDMPANFIAVNDIAQVVLKVFKNPEYYNQLIELGGPDNLTKNEVVGLYEKYAGKHFKRSYLPLPILRGLSTVIQPFHPGISRIMKAGIYGETVPGSMNNSYTVSRFRLKPTSAEEFVKEKFHSLKEQSINQIN